MEKQKEKLEYKAKNNPDYLWVSGSHLYGTNCLGSDVDLRGFVFPDFDYLVNIKKFESIELQEDDHKIYSAQYFLKLALKGDPLVTEGFFANEENIVECSEFGKEVLNLKEHLISNAIYGRIMGYSTGEWRKAMAIKLVSTKFNKTKQEVISDMRNLWKLDKEKMDSIIEILDSVDEKQCISSIAQLGAKRREDIQKYGFCRKSAAHSIRLVKQVTELMETGNIIFPRPDKDLLLDIRNGKYSKEELEEIHSDVVADAEKMRNKSILPEKPNEKIVWDKYLKLIANVIKKDERFLQLIQ